MELYFNPYPGAAQSCEAGLQNVLDVADALVRLKKEFKGTITGITANNDLGMTELVIIRNADALLGIKDVFYLAKGSEREKITILLSLFSKGKIIDLTEMPATENWILKTIGTDAPILEIAAKENATALTIAAGPEWRIDVIEFDGRLETLHNLWGQKNLSSLINHCINAIKNTDERFMARFDAVFCRGAAASGPDVSLWESYRFFSQMDKAKARDFVIDDDLIKNVEDTKYGALRELRCVGEGLRIFFVYRKDVSPKVLVGGFYQKNSGLSQDDAIQNARKRVNDF